MKFPIAFLLLVIIPFFACGQKSNPNFDEALAQKLGGDEYGMKMYVLAILSSGENKTTDKPFIDSCFAGHIKNIQKLAAENRLVVSGPFAKNKSDFRGLFIFNVSKIDEAQALLSTDPAINANLLKAELYPWYGSAALPEYLSAHDKIWKSNP